MCYTTDMAKKRKEPIDEEQKTDKLNLPKFDEAAFVAKEKRNIRALYLSFIMGFIMALVCFGFWALLKGNFLRWELVLLLGVVNASWLRYLFIRLKIDVSQFTRKNWMSAYLTYFFTWLIIFIVLVNPPFYDDADPIIEISALPGMQEPGGNVHIVALILDNVEVQKDNIIFTLTDPWGTTTQPSYTYQDHIFSYTQESPSNYSGTPLTYTYQLNATDPSGHTTSVNGTFTFTEDALRLVSSLTNGLRSGDKILFKADETIDTPDNFRVYYTINGEEINATRDDPTDREMYETSAEYNGWEENSNQTVQLYAEVYAYFTNMDQSYNNTVIDTETYSFNTGTDSDIGTLESPSSAQELGYSLPQQQNLIATPGFELVAVLGALAVCLILIGRKKKDTDD